MIRRMLKESGSRFSWFLTGQDKGVEVDMGIDGLDNDSLDNVVVVVVFVVVFVAVCIQGVQGKMITVGRSDYTQHRVAICICGYILHIVNNINKLVHIHVSIDSKDLENSKNLERNFENFEKSLNSLNKLQFSTACLTVIADCWTVCCSNSIFVFVFVSSSFFVKVNIFCLRLCKPNRWTRKRSINLLFIKVERVGADSECRSAFILIYFILNLNLGLVFVLVLKSVYWY